MRVLVTGGAGFIGSHLAAALVRKGERVRVLDRVAAGSGANEVAGSPEIEGVEADVRDAAAVRNAVEGVEVVFHLAADASVPRSILDPATCYDVNVTGTLNVLSAARAAGCRRVVFASSSAVYGDDPALPKRETMPPRPVSPYASSKLAGEDLCAVFRRSYGLETVALRFFNVYGPGQNPNGDYAPVVPRFIEAIRHGRAVTIYGGGQQTRDFVYVEDVVRAMILAATTPDVSGGPYNVASGQALTLLRLAETIGAVVGRAALIDFLPSRPGDVRHSAADISAIHADLKFMPAVTLESGLSLAAAATAGNPGL